MQPIKFNTTSIAVQKRIQTVYAGTNVSIEQQEIVLGALIQADKNEKRKKKEEFKTLSKWEKEQIKEKNRELNKLKKEKQKEWKNNHKEYIKNFNKNYYEENKESIKKQKRERYQAQKLEKQNEDI